MRRNVLALAVLLALALVRPAWADCDPNAGEAQLSACLAQDLRDSDKRINAVYKALAGTLDEAQRLALRDEQRAWLKRRDKTCALDAKETDREKWLQAIMADPAMTICVVRFTFSRVGELDALLKAKAPAQALPELPPAPSAPVAAPAAAPTAPVTLRSVDEGYGLISMGGRRTGRWYYEVWIDRGAIAQRGDVLLQVAIASATSPGAVRNVSVRRNHPELGPVAIAMAVDLDMGLVYTRQNGQWAAMPGSSGGIPVRLNNEYVAAVRSSSDLISLVFDGLVKINMGERPFEYSMPDGYRPFGER